MQVRFLPLVCFLAFCVLGCTSPAISQPPAEELKRDDANKDLWTRKKGVNWPQFLGPKRDSKSIEKGIIAPWPKDGLKVVWSRPLDTSYDIGSAAYGRFYQYDREGDRGVMLCLNAETGKQLWRYEHTIKYEDLYGYNGGPRCSPLVEGNRVYFYGPAGQLHCLRANTGTLIWKRDVNKEFGVIQNFFGVGSTPSIFGDLLVTMVGGSPAESKSVAPGALDRVVGDGSGIVAFDKWTGAVKYKSTDELASYASMQTANIDGRPWGFAFCRGGLVGFDPTNGKVDFEYPWRSRILESVNASTPVVVNDEVFISETYGPGSTLLKVKPGGYDVVWKDDERTREKSMQTHWNTAIHVDGYLYGSSGRHTHDADLRCIEWRTGKVQWSEVDTTRTSLLYVDGHFINLGEYGNLQLIKANPKKFELVSEMVLRGPAKDDGLGGTIGPMLLKYPCWAAPILSHGLLYVRGKDRLVCLELIPE